MSSTYEQQQKRFDEIAEQTASDLNELWKQGDFGGISATTLSGPRDTRDFGGLVREQRISLRPADFTDTDFEELARRDPNFKAKLDEQRMDAVTDGFRKANPLYLSTKANYETMLKHIRSAQLQDVHMDLDDVMPEAYARGYWKVENLSSVFRHLKAKGRLELPAEQAKELTSEEKLIVTAKVRAGNPGAAIMAYLRFSLPNRDVGNLSIENFAVEYPELMHKVVWNVFEAMHPEISSDEFKSFAQDLRHVRLPTVAVLEQALQMQKEDRFLSRNAQPHPMPGPPSSSPEPVSRAMTEDEIRDLSDEELNKLIAQEKKAAIKRTYSP